LGTLGVEGTADLFLLNPNGILFGPNARLDVRGSFLATTADRLLFDNYTFSASAPTAPPLLTLSVPVGLQMGNNPTGITVNQANLQVSPTATFGLLGGDLTLSGRLTAGQLELGSGGPGFVALSATSGGYDLNYANLQAFQDIQLNAASIDLNHSGNIHGRNITIAQGSQIQTNPLERDRVTLVGSAAVDIQDSRLTLAGQNGNLLIQTPTLRLSEGARIGSESDSLFPGSPLNFEVGTLSLTSGSQIFTIGNSLGPAGNISIVAGDRVSLSGNSVVNGTRSASSITSQARGNGNTGSIRIETPLFQMGDGALVSVNSDGSGNTGDLNIQANTVQLLDGSIRSQTNRGQAGDLILVGRNLVQLSDRPDISTSTVEGTAGSMTLAARRIVLTDGTQIVSRAASFGNAGDITIEAEEFVARQGSQVLVDSPGTGVAGQLQVTAGSIVLDDSLLSAETGSGSGGNLFLTSLGTIQLNNRATVSASTREGQGGQVILTAPRLIRLDNGSQLLAHATGQGNAGNIQVRTDRFAARDRSQIAVSSAAAGNAGGLTVNAETLIVNHSQLRSESRFGAPGTIRLRSRGVIRLWDQALISTSTQDSEGGGIHLTAPRSIDLIANSQLLSRATGNGTAGSIEIATRRLTALDQTQVTVDSQGRGQAGQIQVNANAIALDQSRFI
jgi:large exoprotein involved in heme utilization and adhesion